MAYDETTGFVHGFDGWALKRALALEPADPGLIVDLLKAKTVRRQAAFALLAQLNDGDDLHRIAALLAASTVDLDGRYDSPAKLVARAIRHGRPDDLAAVLSGGHLPSELMGCLARLGHRPMTDGSLYADLIELCRTDVARASVIKMCGTRFNEEALRALMVVDPIALDPVIFSKIGGAGDARMLTACLAVIRRTCGEATDETIAQSLGAMEDRIRLDRWTDRFLLRNLDRLGDPGPFAEDDTDFETLTTGRRLASVGRQFRNCLASQVRLVAAGRAIYCAARPRRIIIEFRRLVGDARWLAVEAFGPKNAKLSSDDWKFLFDALSERGVPFLAASDRHGEDLLELGGGFFFPHEPLAMSAIGSGFAKGGLQ